MPPPALASPTTSANPADDLTPGCREDFIERYRNRITKCGVPEWTCVDGIERKVPATERFYPVESLRDIFTTKNIKEILDHRCTNCERYLGTDISLQCDPRRIISTDTSIGIFALLVWLRYPLLIGNFLNIYGSDSVPPPSHINEFHLRDGQFKRLSYIYRDHVIDEFELYKWQFSVPRFLDNSFQKFEKGTILPYVDEKLIGVGGFSKVFKVWVHPYYCNLSSVQNASPSERRQDITRVFVRKEIVDEDIIRCVKEKTNLELIATLRDPHLVEIQKTYQLGNKFNIVFPCADTNLYVYLRDRIWYAPNWVNLAQNPMWTQVLGITGALSKIITFKHPQQPTKVFFGSHHDLKPQNILIDKKPAGTDDVFKITDFGQATFTESKLVETTYLSSDGGTDAYAPPEYLEDKQDRVYDVWSLGIIVVEVLAFAVRGLSGLTDPKTGLDNVRRTREGVNQENCRFYTTIGDKPEVKPAILAWLEDLEKDSTIVKNKDSHTFVENLIRLILRMLEPDRHRRIVIDEVLDQMTHIFNAKPPKEAEASAARLKMEDETVLIDMQTVQYFPQSKERRHSQPVRFIMVENQAHRLRTWIGSPTPLVPLSDQRKSMQLAMVYQHTKETDNKSYEFLFSAINDDHIVSMQNHALVVHSADAAWTLQKAFLGQKVSRRYQLVELSVTKWYPVTEKFGAWMSNKMSKGKEIESPKARPIPTWIELWIEAPQQFNSIKNNSSVLTPEGNSSRRANRQVNPGNQTPRGRVVIYCQDQIIILPFCQEGELRKEPKLKQDRIRHLVFTTMDKKQKEYFPTSCINVSNDGEFPSIPMDHAALYEAEKQYNFHCESLAVDFAQPQDANTFYKLYKNEKGRWLDESKGKRSPVPSLMASI